MKIAIASDHAGYTLKQTVIEYLSERKIAVSDLGTDSDAPSDYPDFAEKIGAVILKNEATRGVLICGSGVGASVAANKIAGIRA